MAKNDFPLVITRGLNAATVASKPLMTVDDLKEVCSKGNMKVADVLVKRAEYNKKHAPWWTKRATQATKDAYNKRMEELKKLDATKKVPWLATVYEHTTLKELVEAQDNSFNDDFDEGTADEPKQDDVKQDEPKQDAKQPAKK